jgi:tripartite-type tricarboxylate transporter receptor subunit TctC
MRKSLQQLVYAASIAAIANSLYALPAAAQQPWPTKPVRLIVPAPPGGAFDMTARLLQAPLADALGKQIVIDYRPGGSGIPATVALVRSEADGHTLALIPSTHASNVFLQPSLPFDAVQDITAVTLLWRAPSAISGAPIDAGAYAAGIGRAGETQTRHSSATAHPARGFPSTLSESC